MIAAVWLGLCIFLAWTIEAMSGFGSIVIALSLGALLLPIADMLPILVTLNVLSGTWLLLQHRRHIDRKLLWQRILPAMLTGTVIGALLRDDLPGTALKTGFALLILWFSLRQLWLLKRGQASGEHKPVTTQGLMLGAGLTHGLFASGGPLLVYALAGVGVPKARFRATLITVWLALNAVLLELFIMQGKMQPYLPRIALYVPVIVLAVILGNRLHHGLDEDKFRLMVFRLLALVGAALLLSQLRQFF